MHTRFILDTIMMIIRGSGVSTRICDGTAAAAVTDVWQQRRRAQGISELLPIKILTAVVVSPRIRRTIVRCPHVST